MELIKNKKDFKRRNNSSDLPALMYGKIPPQAKDLEVAVLGAIMVDREAFDNVGDILRPECFYVEAHQRIYRTFQALQQKNSPIDLLTVVQELKEREEIELVGGAYFVTRLTNGIMGAANITTHARIIVQQFIKRELIRISGEIMNEAYEDSSDCFDLLDDSEKKILEIGTTHIHGGMMSIDTVLIQAIAKIDEWRKNDSPITGVPTGFPELDKATRGWQPGDLIIIAARPSVGKTAFALNLIRNASVKSAKKIKVAVWSLEMKAIYLVLRMLASESNTYLHRIQTGRLDDEQMKNLYDTGVQKLSSSNILFDENSNINIRTLSAKARRLKKQGEKDGIPLGLIVIDYIQLMSGEEKSGNREQEISKISRALKNLAQELEIPVIALSQLSREGDKYVSWDKSPALSSLRESGAIEQDADVVMMLWGATDQEIKEKDELRGRRRVKIVKQRNGVVITNTLDFKNEIQLFTVIEEKISGKYKPIAEANIEQEIKFNNRQDPEDDLPF